MNRTVAPRRLFCYWLRPIAVRGLILLSLLLAANLPKTYAQAIRIEASGNRSQVSMDDQLVYTIAVSSGETQNLPMPVLPKSFEGFSVISGPNRQTSIQVVNVQMTAVLQIVYVLMPVKKGSFTFPPAKVSYKGQEYASAPFTVEVVDTPAGGGTTQPGGRAGQPQGAQGGQQSAEDAKASIFRLEVSKNKAFVGEQILLEYVLYTREQIVDLGFKNLPDLTGFWNEDVGQTQIQQSQTTLDGVPYNRLLLKQQVIFPTSAGTKTIEAIALSMQVAVRGRSRSPFDDFFNDPFFGGSRAQPKYVNSRPVEITVMPLPDSGKPAQFSGTVGDYTLKAGVNKTEVKQGDSVTLTVSVSGRGNIQAIGEPTAPDMSGLKLYNPTVSKKSAIKNGIVSGQKSFEYILVPSVAGKITVPPFTLAIFSPAKGTYETIESNPLSLTVQASDKPEETTMIAAAPVTLKNEVTLLGQDINFIKLTPAEIEDQGIYYIREPWFWAFQSFPLVLIGLVFTVRKRRQDSLKDVAGTRFRLARGVAKKYLNQAAKSARKGMAVEFYGHLGRAISRYLSDKLNLSEAGLTSDQVAGLLIERGVDLEQVEPILEILRQCDYARFAPATVSQDDLAIWLQKARTVIDRLERLKMKRAPEPERVR